jgi:hypothetical protein
MLVATFHVSFSLTMPKNSTPRRLTTTYNKRVALILATRLKIVVPCSCYKKIELKCVIKLITRYYAFCIRAKVRYSLVFSNTKRKEINNA